MARLTPAIAIVGCLSLMGCGEASETTARYRDRVRDWLPAANSIHCSPQAHGAHCTVLVGRPPGAFEVWSCEFTFAQRADREAYSGTESCWSGSETSWHLHVPVE